MRGELFLQVQWEYHKRWQGTQINSRCIKMGAFSISAEIALHVLANFMSPEELLLRAFPSLGYGDEVFSVKMASTDSLADFERKAAQSIGYTARLVHSDSRE